MAALQDGWKKPILSEPSIVLIGLVAVIIGLAFRDSLGISTLLAAIGIGLVIAGTVYIAVEGSEVVRFSAVFTALVALPLLFYGGVIQWIGALMVGAVVVGASYSRVAK